jgi:hypothetical protein
MLLAVPMGMGGIRYVMGQELGHCGEDRAFSMRWRPWQKSVPMWWRVVES